MTADQLDRMEAAARAATIGGDETQPCAGELRPAPDVCLRCGATADEMCRDNEGWRGAGRVSLDADQVLALIAQLRALREAAKPAVDLAMYCDKKEWPDGTSVPIPVGILRRLAAAMQEPAP